jgi:hypothetical protein
MDANSISFFMSTFINNSIRNVVEMDKKLRLPGVGMRVSDTNRWKTNISNI